MNKPEKKGNRRDFIFTASYTVGAIGIGATLWPLIDQMNPDTSVKALASTEVDISQIEPGKSVTVLWRGKPVFIKRRTQEEIVEAQSVNLKELPLLKYLRFVTSKFHNQFYKKIYCMI